MGLALLIVIFFYVKMSQNKKDKVDSNTMEMRQKELVVVGTTEDSDLETSHSVKTVDREILSGTERAVETHTVLLQKDLIDDDLVDVRIHYPNGEEYIVLSKRGCHELKQEEGRVTFFLTEEEILCLSSSIVDCIQFDATLYTVRYLRDKKSISSVVNYIPREDICQLMIDNPNIIGEAETSLQEKYRKKLESRVLDWKKDFTSKVNRNLEKKDSSSGTIHSEEDLDYD